MRLRRVWRETPNAVVGNGLWLYEAERMRCGRGFDSRQLHHLCIRRGAQLKGLHWFRRGEQSMWTAREATDVIGAKTVIANADYYDQNEQDTLLAA